MKRKEVRRDQALRGREAPERVADYDRLKRLISEAENLDKSQEQALADERYAAEAAWPDY